MLFEDFEDRTKDLCETTYKRFLIHYVLFRELFFAEFLCILTALNVIKLKQMFVMLKIM